MTRVAEAFGFPGVLSPNVFLFPCLLFRFGLGCMASLLTSLSDVISDDSLCLSSLSSLGLIPLILTSLTEAHLRNDQILGAIGPFLSSVVLHPVGVQLLRRAQPQKPDTVSRGSRANAGEEDVEAFAEEEAGDLHRDGGGESGVEEIRRVGKRERERRDIQSEHRTAEDAHGDEDGHDYTVDERGLGVRGRGRRNLSKEEYDLIVNRGLVVAGHALQVQRAAYHLQKTIEKNDASSSLFDNDREEEEEQDGKVQWGVCGLLMSATAAPEAVLLDRFGESAAGVSRHASPLAHDSPQAPHSKTSSVATPAVYICMGGSAGGQGWYGRRDLLFRFTQVYSPLLLICCFLKECALVVQKIHLSICPRVCMHAFDVSVCSWGVL